MAITRLDCDIFRGSGALSEASAYVALNPALKPAQMVFAGSTAVIQGLGSQVAYRLALDYFVEGLLGHLQRDERGKEKSAHRDSDDEAAVNALEAAFRSANASVYGFGHKLAAGGRMAASLLAFVVDNQRFAAARVGQGSVYLFRGNQLFPFFSSDGVDRAVVGDIDEFGGEEATQRQVYVGSHSIIDVEVASVELNPGDYVVAFSRPLTTLNETLLFQHLEVLTNEGFPQSQPDRMAEQMCLDVFTQPETVSFACMAALGPEVIYCSKSAAHPI
jgi:serine/threonine protein phosphatase PrpC